MQMDWDTWGEDSFVYSQLCECEEHHLCSAEEKFLKEFHDNGYNMYNTYLHPQTSMLNCPERFIPLVERVVQILDKGVISQEEFKAGLDKIEFSWF
jgi:hypothetical protein